MIPRRNSHTTRIVLKSTPYLLSLSSFFPKIIYLMTTSYNIFGRIFPGRCYNIEKLSPEEEELSSEDIQRLLAGFIICVIGTLAHKGKDDCIIICRNF